VNRSSASLVFLAFIVVPSSVGSFAACTTTELPPGAGVGLDASAGEGGGVPGYPAPHPPLPQATSKHGPVMTAPKVVAISFQGDALQAQLDTWLTQLVAATSYWSGATKEYGVGALQAAAPVHLMEPGGGTFTDSDVQQWLIGKINAGGSFPAPDTNTLYVIYYQNTAHLTMNGGLLCQDFQGYHGDFLLKAGGPFVSYAVVGRCAPPVAGVSELDEVTAEASHEILEAATDPIPNEQPTWVTVDADHYGWSLVAGGGELADLCAPFPNAFYKPTGVSALVARLWSNAAAAASHDPCEPEGTSPYFNAAPVLDDTIQVVGSPLGSFPTKGVNIPVGSSKTIELDLFSDGPTSGPWKVSLLDLTSAFFHGKPALDFSLDKTEGQNGDKLQLTIRALTKSSLGTSPFWVQNDLGGKTTVWIGLVAN
jgi:hypothetical protein